MAEIETHRSMVAPSDCDILGHMNVAAYFAAVSNGGFGIQTHYGLDRDDILHGRRLSFVVVQSESRYIAEVLAGEMIYLKSGLLEIGGKSALVRHRLYKAKGDVLAFETKFRIVLMDLAHRKAVTIPDDVRGKMQGFVIDAEA